MTKNSFVERQIVLGAGASSGGYPLGDKLIEKIKEISGCVEDCFKSPNPIIFYHGDNFVTKIAFTKKELLKVVGDGSEKFFQYLVDLRSDLKRSCATSIDFYTSRICQPERQKVAEALIGAIIKSCKTDLSETWYGHLLPLFFPPNISELDDNQKISAITELVSEVRIVTFNYDLSLEKFLYEFLKNNVFYSQKTGQDKLEEAKKIIFERIEHVYGAIDDSLTCDMEEIEKIDYKLDFIKILKDSFENQEKYSQNIKLIESKRENKVELIGCKYLYILGFGFDPLNIERIKINPYIWGKNNANSSGNNGCCFVTNFNNNQKVKRIALNTLARTFDQYDLLVPIISERSIKEALENDFSLMENPKFSEKIPSSQALPASSSPYFALKKYDKYF